MRGVISFKGTNSVLFVLEVVLLVVETNSSASSGCLRISPLTIFPLGTFLVLVDFFLFLGKIWIERVMYSLACAMS